MTKALTVPGAINFTMYGGDQVPHTLIELKVLGVMIGFAWQTKFAVKQGFESAVRATAALPEGAQAMIEAIDIEEGWTASHATSEPLMRGPFGAPFL